MKTKWVRPYPCECLGFRQRGLMYGLTRPLIRTRCGQSLEEQTVGGVGQGQGAEAVLVKSGALWAAGGQSGFILHILCWAWAGIGKQNRHGHSPVENAICSWRESVNRRIHR